MSTASVIPTERLLRAIVTQFCKQNFSFVKSMRIIGSIHVVVDNNEVLSCLLNESQDVSDSTTTAATIAAKLAATTTTHSGSSAHSSPATAVKTIAKETQSSKQQQQQQKQAVCVIMPPELAVETLTSTTAAGAASSPVPVTSLNKRKRFVPRAHLDPEPVPIATISATESVAKSELEMPNDDSMSYDNLQESMTEEFQMAGDDTPATNQDQPAAIELVKPINTPGGKGRQVRFSDMTNSAAILTPTTQGDLEMMNVMKKAKHDALSSGGGGGVVVDQPPFDDNDEMYEGGEESEEGEQRLAATPSSSSSSGKLSASAARKAMWCTNGSGGGGAVAAGDQAEYECVPCGKKFKYFCYYKRHMDARHSEEPKFVCEFCSKSYKWEASFRHHMRMHVTNSSEVTGAATREIENKEN